MNLVIDNAVEVKQVTKTNDKESRRSLGTNAPFPALDGITRSTGLIWLTIVQGKSFSRVTTCRSSRACRDGGRDMGLRWVGSAVKSIPLGGHGSM